MLGFPRTLGPVLCAALGLAPFVGAPAQAQNISRYTSPAMTCAEVQGVIAREGAAILRYPGRTGVTLYDRYVVSDRLCFSGEYAKSSTVPTRDMGKCPVQHCEKRPDPADCDSFLEEGCFGMR
ncbi:hypothetical protein [Rhizobium sp. FY34]|uniref:hypothetical protein n=1 Tax=Rhizobium sp. FY34 TaxID=2562309 RepID=UPI001FEE1065|nr:hypothetical protein [Rhizobium sp. FY34]